MDDIILTDKGKIVLTYMQNHDEVLVGKDMNELIGVKNVHLILRPLIKKGLVQQCEPVNREFVNHKGDTLLKDYMTYSLTDKGRNFEIGEIVVKQN